VLGDEWIDEWLDEWIVVVGIVIGLDFKLYGSLMDCGRRDVDELSI
jgi:hypothetical protein